MPDRIIRESALLSETLDALGGDAERLFWRLTVVADDHGRFDADPRVLLAKAFPLRVDRMKSAVLERWRNELAVGGLIELYRIGSRTYGRLVSWTKHQRRRDSRPKFPGPEEGEIIDSRQLAATRGSVPQVGPSCGSRAHVREPCTTESRESLTTGSREAGDSPQPAASPPPRLPPWPSPEALVQLYNQDSPDECPAVQVLSDKRRDKARKYLAQFPEQEFWREVMAQCRASPFLRGLRKREGHNGFVADFDWLLTAGRDGSENVVKVHDGRYRDG